MLFLINANLYQLGFLELLLMPVCLALVFGVASMIAPKEQPHRKFFFWGLGAKVFGGFCFGLVFIYYYKGADTTRYFTGCVQVWNYFWANPTGYLDLLLHGENHLDVLDQSDTVRLVQQIAGTLNLFAFNSFWVLTLWFSVISFWGVWRMYRVFADVYPHLAKQIAICILFIPGVFFWSSGILKDTICLCGTGFMTAAMVEMITLRRRYGANFLTMAFWVTLILGIKAYIVIALFGAFGLLAFFSFLNRIKNPAVRAAAVPVLLGVIGIALIAGYGLIAESLQKFALENILETASTYDSYLDRASVSHTTGNRTGSAYDLGDVDFNSPVSLLGVIPKALTVTYFRPFLWEVNNPVMLLAALESLIITIFFLRIIFKTGFRAIFRNLFADPHNLMCLAFAVVFGLAVGLTSGNFGTLVRYKIVSMPFFALSLVLFWNSYQVEKQRKRNLRNARVKSGGESKSTPDLVSAN